MYFINFIILAIGWKNNKKANHESALYSALNDVLNLGSIALSFKYLLYYLKTSIHKFSHNALWVFTEITAARFELLYHLKTSFHSL